MTVASLKLQSDLKGLMDSFVHLRDEGLDIYNLYWKGGVTGDISGLSSGDPASYSTRLTKAQLNQGLTLVDQLGNIFFENSAVTTGDYMATCQILQYGNATATQLTPGVEGYANKLLAYVRYCVDVFNRCRNCENFYGAVLYSTITGLGSGTDTVPGADMTKDEALAAMALVHQFQLFIGNASVTADFYKTTLGLWGRF